MTPQEQAFVNYWSEKRKKWSWRKYSYTIFITIVIPFTLLVDLVNFFIIGDTTYSFLSFSHLFVFLSNLVILSVVIIMGSGIINWNFNENKYWHILRKNADKLQ